MFNLGEFQSVYTSRKKESEGITCVLRYDDILKQYINNINNEILKLCEYYESYEENLHLTLIGLEKNFSKHSQDILKKLGKSISLKVERVNIKLEQNGLVVIELELDSNSKKNLTKYRKSLEEFNIEYKHKNNIDKLHSVIGLFDYERIKNLSDETQKEIFEKVQQTILNQNTTPNNILLCKQEVVKYSNTELKKAEVIKLD